MYYNDLFMCNDKVVTDKHVKVVITIRIAYPPV